MIGRMDSYVARNVLGAWVMSNVFFLLLFVLVDLLLGLGSITKALDNGNLGLGQVVYLVGRYYLFSLPLVFVTVGPFVTVISSMFAIARLQSGNELVPMIFTGRSVFRVLLPVAAVATMSALLMGAVWEWGIPRVHKELSEIDRALQTDEPVSGEVVIKRRGGQRQTLFASNYDSRRERLLEVEVLREGAVRGDEVKVVAESAQWNQARGDWDLVGGRLISATSDTPTDSLGLDGLTPEEIRLNLIESKEVDALSYSQLLEMQAKKPDVPVYRLAFHAHITFPLANFVLLLLVLPFAISFERRTRVEFVLFAILACGAYLIFDLTCRQMGSTGYLDAAFAVWLPPIVFGSLGTAFATGVRT